MIQVSLNYHYWEDLKKYVVFMLLMVLSILKLLVLIMEKLNLIILVLHFNTLFALILLFLFKNHKWIPLLYYFIFQMMGSILLEMGYSMQFFKNDLLILSGLFLKLGLFPFIGWYPTFVNNVNWLKFFFFNTINKFPLFYLLSLVWVSSGVMVCIVTVVWALSGGLFSLTQNFTIFKIKFFLGWLSMVDAIFFSWLASLNFPIFMILYFIYSLLYLVISIVFNYSFNYDLSMNNHSTLVNLPLFILGNMMILFLMGFPPLFPFLMKYTLIVNLYGMTTLFTVYFFFFISLIQAVLYLRLLFTTFTKYSFKPKSIGYFPPFLMYFFFFLFFFW